MLENIKQWSEPEKKLYLNAIQEIQEMKKTETLCVQYTIPLTEATPLHKPTRL